MAGNYPDVPSWRMPYDRDGTQLYHMNYDSGVLTQLDQSIAAMLNDEDNDGYHVYASASDFPYDGGHYLILMFPEKRDLDAYAYNYSSRTISNAWVSTDTTNGADGTWTSIPLAPGQTLKSGMRSGIQSVTALGIRALKLQAGVYGSDGGTNFRMLHLYGEVAPGENPDRLMIWHPALDQRVDPAYFDWGNTPRGSSKTRSFRIKNVSPAKQANSIRVAMDVASDSSPSILGQMDLTIDGSSYLAQVNIGDLLPGEISDPVTIRRDILENAQMGLWWYRVFAEASEWV